MVKTAIFPGQDVCVGTLATKRYVPREVCAYRVAAFSGPMRKHGGDHAQDQDRTLRELDVVAGAQLSGHVFAVRIRRRGAIVGGVTRVR